MTTNTHTTSTGTSRLHWEVANYRDERADGTSRAQALRSLIDVRGELAWRLSDLSAALMRLSHALCDDLPRDTSTVWEDGRQYGERQVWRAIFANVKGANVAELHAACMSTGTTLAAAYGASGPECVESTKQG
ncbi:MAG: hypothetical protein M3Y71_09870 [Actinomycetota bacterium]|nr:hypothetical protein [Actinomycetota bacterium]